MPQARGFFEKLLGIFEASYAVTPSINPGDMFLLPFNDNSVGSEENMIDPSTITGTRFPVEPIFGNISVQGSITVPMEVRSIGQWLKLLLGVPATTDNLATTFTHIFFPKTETPSMTI